MLLVLGKYQLPLLGFRKWNWIFSVLLIQYFRTQNTTFSGYFGANYQLLPWWGLKKERDGGKIMLEIKEVEVTYGI